MKYWLGANTGSGFIQGKEQLYYGIRGYAGNIWVTNDSDNAVSWGSRNNLTEKTKSQATTIQQTAITNAVSAWNDISDAIVKGSCQPGEADLP